MTKQEFINRVLLIMNEASMADTQGNQFTGADTAQVDRYIEGSYVDAWRRCVKVMPQTWFANETFDDEALVPDLADGTGYVKLPDDFYLLTSFKMSGWQKAVQEALIENERVIALQSNEYTRGSHIRPVCTISQKIVESQVVPVLNYYSLKRGLTEHKITEAIYIPLARPLKEIASRDELQLGDQVIEPLAYLSASTVFTMFEKSDISKDLEQRAIEMFPGLQDIKGVNLTMRQ